MNTNCKILAVIIISTSSVALRRSLRMIFAAAAAFRRATRGCFASATVFCRTLCIVAAVAGMAACKSPTIITAPEAGLMKSDEAFFSSLLDGTPDFRTLSARLRVELSVNGQELSSRAQLKMVYNERVHISIQPLLGIEMFRIEITADSLKVIDRMNKRYIAESYEAMKDEAGIALNLQNLQSLLTNRIFIPGSADISPDDIYRFRMARRENSSRLSTRDENGWHYTFIAGSDERLQSANIYNPSANQTLNWSYSDFQSTERLQRFPLGMKIGYTSGSSSLHSAVLTLSAPEVNTPLKMDFLIPSGYDRMTFVQLLKSFDAK